MALHKEIWWNYNDIQKPKIELTREQTQELFKKFQERQEKSQVARRLWDEDSKHTRENELPLYEKHFNWEIDETALQRFINQTKKFDEQKATSQIEEENKKAKLEKYSQLANVAYSDFKVESDWKLAVKDVKLDPLSFIHLWDIIKWKYNWELSEDELFVKNYVSNPKNIELAKRQVEENIYITNLPQDIEWIITLNDKVKPTVLANLDDKYTNSPKTDIIEWIPINTPLTQVDKVLWANALKELKWEKIVEMWDSLKKLWEEFNILDYYPKGNEKNESGFWAVCLESKTGEIYIAIRWTELSDFWDLKADLSLMFKRVPKNQTASMIDFINRALEKIPKDKKVNIIWHSLGWALTQIATTIYRDIVWESYTFNSPWAKNLSTSLNENDPYFKSLQEFMTNKDSSNVSRLVTNVRWEKWISLIANLWVDIWDYEIVLKDLSSHSIVATYEYIHNLDKNSPELESILTDKNDWKIND